MDFYRPGEVARRLGVTVRTLERWADRGMVPSLTLESGHRRYPKLELDAYIEGRRAS